MARSRNIKPGFFTNEDLVELDFPTRLLFAGLWTIADREGRLQDRPKKIKIDIFPADNLDVDLMLSALDRSKFIQRYEVAGEKFIKITNWARHQNPHHTEKASIIPDVNGDLTVKTPLEPKHPPKQDGGNLADSLLLIPDSLIPDSLSNTPIPPVGACDQKTTDEVIDESPTRKPRKQSEPFVLPDWIPSETWAAFMETRKKKKAANTDFALGLVIKTLTKFRDAGHDPIEALENSIKGGWSDVYEPKPRATAAGIRPQLSYIERDRIAGMQQWEKQCNQRHPDLEAEYSLLVNTGHVIDAATPHMRISK